jgi:hypothetical protein
MPDPLRSPWTRLALAAVFLAPVAMGFALESRWLTQAGFIVPFAFMLGCVGMRCSAGLNFSPGNWFFVRIGTLPSAVRIGYGVVTRISTQSCR